MARPVHTVKYMQSQFRKYQSIAITLAILAITTSLIAALSNIREDSLRKKQVQAVELETSRQEQQKGNVQKELERATKALSEAEDKLDKEKQTVKNLRDEISALQIQISSLKTKIKDITSQVPPPPVTDQEPAPQAPKTASSPALNGSSNTTRPTAAPQPVTPQEEVPEVTTPIPDQQSQ